MCDYLNKNKLFLVKRLQLFKQILIPLMHKNHKNDRNLKAVEIFLWVIHKNWFLT